MKFRLLALGFAFLPVAGGLAFAEDPAVEAGAMVIVPMARAAEFPTRAWTGNVAELSFQGPFADALKSLLIAGFPDPAGSPYRKISIVVGDPLGGREVRETEGWVLPAGDDGVSHAIAWNGLVYPVVRSSGDADFEKTVAEFMGRDSVPVAPMTAGEAMDVMPDQAVLAHGLYLTRFGKDDAAGALLNRLVNASRSSAALLANDWLRNLHERAVCAYVRGDARMALASIREMERVKPALSKPVTVPPKAKAAAVPKTNTKTKGKAKTAPKPKEDQEAAIPVAIVSPDVSLLKSECERVIREGKSGPFDVRGFLAAEPDVPALIGALDRIALAGGGKEARIDFMDSPVVQALVEKGDEAAGPLLECLANDPRLTRSVNFWRDPRIGSPQPYTLNGVQEAVTDALGRILVVDVSGLDTTSAKGRAMAARMLRADWEKYGRATGAERAHRILKDDTATRMEWTFAAGALFPEDRFTTGGPFPGDVLRDKSEPPVSNLLEKRIADCGKKGDKESDAEAIRCRLLTYLLWWDPERGRAAIARQVDEWIAKESWKTSLLVLKDFIEATAGDSPDSLRLFEKMVWTLGPGEDQDLYPGESVTRTLARHGDSPELARSREGLWSDPQSPWCLAKMGRADLESLLREWQRQGVTRKEPFRGALAGLLTDQGECAAIMIDPKAPKLWQMRDGGKASFSRPVPEDGNFRLTAGEAISVRRADVAAKALSSPDGGKDARVIPTMEYWWPQEARDARNAEVVVELGR